MSFQILKGAADVTRYVVLKGTDGLVETGYTITNLDLQYTRNREEPAAKADASALADQDSAHADNSAIEVDGTNSPGLYRVDWPDDAFATGADKVILCVSGSGLDPAFEEIQLVDHNPETAIAAILDDTGTSGVAIADGAISSPKFGSGALDSAALNASFVDEILDDPVGDGAITVREAIRVILAASAGKLSGAATTTVAIRDVADSKDVITATVDADGNRSATSVVP